MNTLRGLRKIEKSVFHNEQTVRYCIHVLLHMRIIVQFV